MLQVRVHGVVASSVLLGSCVSDPAFHGPLPVRNQHPAQLTVLHLPTTGTRSLASGQVGVRGDAAYSNLYLLGTGGPGNTSTNWFMDGEYLRTAAGLRAGFGNGLEFGMELPFAHTSGGFLDGFVIDYHDTFGLPDQGREDNPKDGFDIRARRLGQNVWTVDQRRFELLDVPIHLAWQFADAKDGLGAAVRAGIELPTGNDARGYGNGELDVAVAVMLEHHAFGLAFHGHVQHAFAGTPQQSRAVGFRFEDVTSAGGAIELPLGADVTALVQVEWETSTLRNLGIPVAERDQLLLWVGGRIQLDRDCSLELSFGEDLAGLVSPDFTAWLGLAWVPGASAGS